MTIFEFEREARNKLLVDHMSMCDDCILELGYAENFHHYCAEGKKLFIAWRWGVKERELTARKIWEEIHGNQIRQMEFRFQ